MTNANLDGAHLDTIFVRPTTATNTVWRDATAVEANLRRANLFDSDLRGTDLSDVDDRGAELWGAYANEQTRYSGPRNGWLER